MTSSAADDAIRRAARRSTVSVLPPTPGDEYLRQLYRDATAPAEPAAEPAESSSPSADLKQGPRGRAPVAPSPAAAINQVIADHLGMDPRQLT